MSNQTNKGTLYHCVIGGFYFDSLTLLFWLQIKTLKSTIEINWPLPMNNIQRICNMQFTDLSEQELIWSVDVSMIIECIQWFNFWEPHAYLITRPILGNSI